ncbi:AAA family ATPase [Streptococcus parauberis]|uniref:AAA family ATPase n=1 Tax=Streptococcus parauberis TaxID=1348 RepID=UPI00289097AE|nr:AAA family ATPase [Streptococcus parauberis]MDT2750336.1 AAA family ATPase [Streptococcus parauberis]
MGSKVYQVNLIKECRSLDSSVMDDKVFEKIALEIIENQNSQAPLLLINQIGLLKKSKPKFENISIKIIESLYLYLGAKEVEESYNKLKIDSSYSMDDLQTQLNQLVGLNAVKNQVNDLITYNKIQQLREEEGLKRTSKTLHMAFLGNPGTAKTTVARIVGKMYKSLGLLSKGHFIEASRTDLIAEYQGQTAIKVKKLVNRAKGGVLFIDEAYSITENEKSDSYGKESLTELTKALEDYRDDLVVIVAGYSDLMDKFFESNPGLKSRFNTFIDFPDYSLNELVEIFMYTCKIYDYAPGSEATEKVREIFKLKTDENIGNFSNGRMVRNFFDDVVLKQSKRLANTNFPLNKNQLSEIIVSDIPIVKPKSE